MSYVSASDFSITPYQLAGLDDVVNTFPAYVTREERLVQIELFGRILYAAFMAGLAVDASAQEQRWKDLRDGADYVYFGKTFHWDGMKEAMVPYIYSKWSQDNESSQSGNGAIVQNTENSTVVSNAAKIVQGHNRFAELVGDNYWTRGEGGIYASWLDYNRYSIYADGMENTLAGFLYNSGDTYLDVVSAKGYGTFQEYLDRNFRVPGYMNIFNI